MSDYPVLHIIKGYKIYLVPIDDIEKKNIDRERDDTFLNDIKSRGVERIVVLYKENTKLLVHDGAQRIDAAIAAGYKTIKAVICNDKESCPSSDQLYS